MTIAMGERQQSLKIPPVTICQGGQIIFVDGMVGLRDGELVPGGLEAELLRVLEIIKESVALADNTVLGAENSGLPKIVRLEVDLSDLPHSQETVESILQDWFLRSTKPACTFREIRVLPHSAHVQISATAFFPTYKF